MAPTMLLGTLVTGLLLAGVYLLFARVATRRRVDVRADPEQDPLLAVPAEQPTPSRLASPRRVAAGALLLGLALTTFGIAVTVDLGEGVFWAVGGVVLLYPALVFLQAAGRPPARAN